MKINGKKLSGVPLEKFVNYKKSANETESSLKNQKTKKKHVRLADILPSSAKLSGITKKTSKFRLIKKSAKKKLANGDSVDNAKSRTHVHSKKSKSKHSSIHSKDSEIGGKSVEMEQLEVAEPQLGETALTQPKKKNKSHVGNDTIVEVTSPEKNGESHVRRNDECDYDAKVPQGLSNDPAKDGKSLFRWLIHPLPIEDFFKNNWERAPLHIKRSTSNYYKLLMSTPLLDKILRDFHVFYSKNIDITSYTDGQRETHNPTGRARPSVVWDYYSNGCSVRMLNPQTFIPKLHALNATLQEFFGCFVGANSYLTPPDSQGFAPHYDDIEAFIIQIEGKKRWRLYRPVSESEFLPRYSSKNFDPSEIGEPILDAVVNAGDLLYFPRGTIHQGETIDGTHSLHITLSVYQKNSWCDFLEKLLPDALKNAIATDSRFREGLPLDYLKHVGFVNSTSESQVRQNFIDKTKDLLHRLVDNIDVDKIADGMAKGHIHDFLPPVLTPQEKECSVVQDGERMMKAGTIENRVEIEPDTKIRLLRSHCVRLVEEEDCMRIYYSSENSKEYHEYEPQFLEVDKEFAPAVTEIIRCYPDFIRVDDLPIDGEDNKVQVARDLWEKCIVVTDVPLPTID